LRPGSGSTHRGMPHANADAGVQRHHSSAHLVHLQERQARPGLSLPAITETNMRATTLLYVGLAPSVPGCARFRTG
jgi:hypothetical protein